MKYEIHQIHLTDKEIDKVNAEGHYSVDRNRLSIEMYSRQKQSVPLAQEAWNKGYFTHVANIKTKRGLSGVFQIGNIGLSGDPEESLQRLSEMHSVSVGDIVKDEHGTMFVCDNLGWKEVS